MSTSNSWCSWGRPWTPVLPASTSHVLGLLVWASYWSQQKLPDWVQLTGRQDNGVKSISNSWEITKLLDLLASLLCSQGAHLKAQVIWWVREYSSRNGPATGKSRAQNKHKEKLLPKALDASDFPLLLGFWFLSRRISAVATCPGRKIFIVLCQLPRHGWL